MAESHTGKLTLLEVLTSLKNHKSSQNILPNYSSVQEVRKASGMTDSEFRAEVSRLKKEGKVRLRRGVNLWFIELI